MKSMLFILCGLTLTISATTQKVGCYKNGVFYGINECPESETVGDCCSRIPDREIYIKSRRGSRSEPNLSKLRVPTSRKDHALKTVTDLFCPVVPADDSANNVKKTVTVECHTWSDKLGRFMPLTTVRCLEGTQDAYDRVCQKACSIIGIPVESDLVQPLEQFTIEMNQQ